MHHEVMKHQASREVDDDDLEFQRKAGEVILRIEPQGGGYLSEVRAHYIARASKDTANSLEDHCCSRRVREGVTSRSFF